MAIRPGFITLGIGTGVIADFVTLGLVAGEVAPLTGGDTGYTYPVTTAAAPTFVTGVPSAAPSLTVGVPDSEDEYIYGPS